MLAKLSGQGWKHRHGCDAGEAPAYSPGRPPSTWPRSHGSFDRIGSAQRTQSTPPASTLSFQRCRARLCKEEYLLLIALLIKEPLRLGFGLRRQLAQQVRSALRLKPWLRRSLFAFRRPSSVIGESHQNRGEKSGSGGHTGPC
jgi:hypothetical protein